VVVKPSIKVYEPQKKTESHIKIYEPPPKKQKLDQDDNCKESESLDYKSTSSEEKSEIQIS